ncbi:MAG TPA: aspartyl protease family protein [Pyrinomonadaceae bacterium]|nr:aspartyl protease family protein [Pyrinomonadaceae bacterium]
MKGRLKTSAFGVASALFLASLMFGWAATSRGVAAHPRFAQASAAPPSPVGFQESDSRGLLVRAWVNGSGPYSFAVDTGAGANILSQRVAAEARVQVEAGGRGFEVGGLSGATVGGARRAFPRSFAAGSRENALPARGLFVVAPGLPPDVDGVLDPTESYTPFGFSIDIPNGVVTAFDPRQRPLHASDAPPEGAVVRWLNESGSRRPFVQLAEGRRALVDTGSGFGLAVDGAAARALGIPVAGQGRHRDASDLAGGRVLARRIRPATVNVGPLALRGVPTDLLVQAQKGAPVILGRDALRPFRISFDPLNRLIMFEPID